MTWLIERRLTDTSTRLRNARTELSILDEQLAVITEEAEDSRIRAMVAETPQALTEHSEGQRHVKGMGKARADLVKKIAELTQQQDELLDQMSKKPTK
jgi:hypothetical protein